MRLLSPSKACMVYVLISRVTDPVNFSLIGIPPKDLLEDLGAALIAANINVDAFFEAACTVTGEWTYDKSKARLKDRIDQKFCHERSIPLKFRSLPECLNPQPEAHVIFRRVVEAGRTGCPLDAVRRRAGQEEWGRPCLQHRRRILFIDMHAWSSSSGCWTGRSVRYRLPNRSRQACFRESCGRSHIPQG